MTMASLVQIFRLGDRVQPKENLPFIIDSACIRGWCVMYSAQGRAWYRSDDLTLAPERPPYVPSERLVVVTDCDHTTRIAYYQRYCRCETDAEMATRHAVERAAYDAQGDEA